MSDAYIEQREDAFMVAGTRVSLDSIVSVGPVCGGDRPSVSDSESGAGLRRNYLLLGSSGRDRPVPWESLARLRWRTTGRARCRPDVLSEAGRGQEAESAPARRFGRFVTRCLVSSTRINAPDSQEVEGLGRDSAGELNFVGAIQKLHHRAHLSADEAMRGRIRKKGHDVHQAWCAVHVVSPLSTVN